MVIKNLFLFQGKNAPEEDELLLIPEGWEPPVINEVFPLSAAERAGLKEGDRPLYLNDQFVINTAQFQGIVASNKGKEIPIVVQRDNDTVNLGITPRSGWFNWY
jgi:S1-C subfamily serine protease